MIQRFELEPKISEEEITAVTHVASEHIGKSEHFKELLKLLISLNAFGQNVSANRIASLMYAESSFSEPTENQEKAGKYGTYWGERRFDKLRSGRASFTMREAAYFFEVFRKLFGDEWANLITIPELIMSPLKDNLEKLRASNLPTTWDNLNPVQALHILEAS